MKIKVSLAQRIFDICNVIFMLFMIAIMLYPVWHVACASFSDSNTLLGHQGLLLLPKGFNVEAYKENFGRDVLMEIMILFMMPSVDALQPPFICNANRRKYNVKCISKLSTTLIKQ